MLMISPIQKLEFDDLTETIPIFTVIILMSFTYNIGIGMTAGFVVYPLIKTLAGRPKEVPPGLWFLGLLSLFFFAKLWPFTVIHPSFFSVTTSP